MTENEIHELPNLQAIEYNLSTCGQIYLHHIPLIKKMGFKTIICARPDHEEIGQPSSEQLKIAIEKENLSYFDIAFSSSLDNIEQCTKFCMACEKHKSNHPVLAFCRTGSRTLMAWYAYKTELQQD